MSTNRRKFLTSAAGLSLAASMGFHRTCRGQEKKQYKACIIGDSKQGGYGHGLHAVWSNRSNIAVTGLADPDPDGRRLYAETTGAQRPYADYREMLEKEKPDLVSICPRWSVNHKEYLLACSEVGAHGYIEKPIAVDLAEADVMVAAIEAKNLKWAIGHQKRMCPVVDLCRELVFQKGLIGEILELRGRGKEDQRAGGEDLIVLGSHIFDLLIYFLGRPDWCASNISVDGRPATAADIGQPSEPLGPILGNQIQATFGFDHELPAYFCTRKNKLGDTGRWGLDVYGTKGIVRIRMNAFPEISWFKSPSWTVSKTRTGWQPLPFSEPLVSDDPSATMNQFVIDDLLQAIEQDRKPSVSLQSGRDSYELIQAVFAAHTHGGRIDLPLVDRRHPLAEWH